MTESFLFFSFFYRFEAPDGSAEKPGASILSAPEEKEQKGVLCRTCLEIITSEEAEREKSGQFEHTFTNAYGYVFRVGCFSDAPGCIIVGEPTEEFTWFNRYSWQFCLCRNCMTHMGWHYRSGSDSFYGLILSELVFP